MSKAIKFLNNHQFLFLLLCFVPCILAIISACKFSMFSYSDYDITLKYNYYEAQTYLDELGITYDTLDKDTTFLTVESSLGELSNIANTNLVDDYLTAVEELEDVTERGVSDAVLSEYQTEVNELQYTLYMVYGVDNLDEVSTFSVRTSGLAIYYNIMCVCIGLVVLLLFLTPLVCDYKDDNEEVVTDEESN